MRVKRKVGKNLDEFLKETFVDDLPPDVAVGMRERIERFRAGKTKSAATSAAWALILRRSAWAVLSILVLVAGILLQGSKSSSPLSDRISALKAEFSSFSTTRR